jgi:hypothetical protein
MWQHSFNEEITKNADLISKTLFKKMDNYDQKRIVGARDTISQATAPGSTIPQNVREKMVEAAFDSLKGMSWSFVRAGTGVDSSAVPMEASSPKPKKKYVL